MKAVLFSTAQDVGTGQSGSVSSREEPQSGELIGIYIVRPITQLADGMFLHSRWLCR